MLNLIYFRGYRRIYPAEYDIGDVIKVQIICNDITGQSGNYFSLKSVSTIIKATLTYFLLGKKKCLIATRGKAVLGRVLLRE